jgi:Retrotransposon gag protein
VKSYALISNTPKEKWMAVATQCMEERPCKVVGTYVKRAEREGSGGSISWEDFKEFMGKRCDATDLVAMSRQKLDHVLQGNDGVEKYVERFISLLGDVETEYDVREKDIIHMFLKGLNPSYNVWHAPSIHTLG